MSKVGRIAVEFSIARHGRFHCSKLMKVISVNAKHAFHTIPHICNATFSD